MGIRLVEVHLQDGGLRQLTSVVRHATEGIILAVGELAVHEQLQLLVLVCEPRSTAAAASSARGV